MNPGNESTASFRECVLIRHPRHGEYALAFITGSTVLQVCLRRLKSAPLAETPSETEATLHTNATLIPTSAEGSTPCTSSG